VAALVSEVAALVADVAALEAEEAASEAEVAALVACSVTAVTVASVVLSPAPPIPLNIAITLLLYQPSLVYQPS